MPRQAQQAIEIALRQHDLDFEVSKAAGRGLQGIARLEQMLVRSE